MRNQQAGDKQQPRTHVVCDGAVVVNIVQLECPFEFLVEFTSAGDGQSRQDWKRALDLSAPIANQLTLLEIDTAVAIRIEDLEDVF